MLFPPRCPVCGEIRPAGEQKICAACAKKPVLVEEPVCKKCGKPVLEAEVEFCYDCEKNGHHYKEGRALWVYDDVMKKSIAAFKYGGRREYAGFYVEELARHRAAFIRRVGPEALIPVPLHPSRERQRGFNQAGILAKGLGEAFRIPVWEDVLIRSRRTTAQKGLDNKERLKNLEQAFLVKKGKEHEAGQVSRILLIDDIYTTGSTIEACGNALLRAGAGEIYFLALCIGKGF